LVHKQIISTLFYFHIQPCKGALLLRCCSGAKINFKQIASG
jgi:hypothetical protein